jgi:alanine racemase
MFSFHEIAELSGCSVLSNNAPNVPIKHFITDSRSVHFPFESMFVAIQGKNHDGHQYLEVLYNKGIRNFVVENEAKVSEFIQKNANVLVSQRALHFLQSMAAYKRSLYTIPVVAITGSNAKTIVKEWLWQLLQHQYAVVKSPKSYNSQLGVPLSVWEMEDYHEFAIFEAGISQAGEMERLQKIIQPNYGIFTNIGSAHNEGFASQQEKVKEKLKLFTHIDQLVYCADHELIHEEVQSHFIPSFTWSRKQSKADVWLKQEVKKEQGLEVSLVYKETEHILLIPFHDEASIENALHAIVFLMMVAYPMTTLQTQLLKLEPVKMRLEIKNGIQGNVIIDDTYNNDLKGLTLALDFAQQHQHGLPITVILSDVLESGLSHAELYESIAQLLNTKGITQLYAIGKTFHQFQYLFTSNARFFETTEHFFKEVDLAQIKHQVLLIKGARSFYFEQITKLFEAKIHGTRFEVNLDALLHNYQFYKSVLPTQTKIMAMVKAFAYGSGSYEVAQLLQHHGVDYLAVAYADEGVALRNHGIQIPIMVMNPDQNSFRTLIKYKLEPEIYSFKILKEWLAFVDWQEVSSSIHLKMDTGMHRLGFLSTEVDVLLQELAPYLNRIKIASVFTHLAATDETSLDEYTLKQINLFKALTQKIEQRLGYHVIKHVLNSAGIIRFPEYAFDMSRLGIGLYGVEVSETFQKQLMTVGVLKTYVSQIKHLEAGQTVGYSCKGKILQASTIATIAIGYADGYDRRFSNGVGKINVNGVLCPVIGNVCMDMTMVDVTGVEVNEGDEVIVFGENPSVIDAAKSINTIAYELLTGIGERVRRVFYKA